MMKMFAPLVAGMMVFAVTACSESPEVTSEASSTADEPSVEASNAVDPDRSSNEREIAAEDSIQIHTVAGGPEQTVQLLPSKARSEVAPMADFIADMGYQCDQVLSVRQLKQNGEPMDVFKIDCADGSSYQATIMNDNTYVKPWTGVMMGD